MSYRPTLRSLLAGSVSALAGASVLAGCLGEASPVGAPAAANESPPTADRPLPMMYSTDSIVEEIKEGGPPKDGIPSIDEPSFITPSEADKTLLDGDVVFGVVRNGVVKAYPQSILVWHELVNDSFGGETVTISYCPLTGTAMGFRRGGTTFGVSGKLVNNNLVMYDRETDSRWSQVLATAIDGTFRGSSLQEFRVVWTTWGTWKTAYPNTRVLSQDTGYVRDYDRDPYGEYNPPLGYYAQDYTLFEPLTVDDRLSPKSVVIGARNEDGAIAFTKNVVRRAGVVAATHDGTPYVAVHDPRLDTVYVYRNSGGATVEPTDDGVSVDGEGHAPSALPLDAVLAFDAMWFAWSGFYPETGLYE